MAIDQYFKDPFVGDVTSARIRLAIMPSDNIGLTFFSNCANAIDYSGNILGNFDTGLAKNMLSRHADYKRSLEDSLPRITGHYESLIRMSKGNPCELQHDLDAVKTLSELFGYGAVELRRIAKDAYGEKKKVVDQILTYNAEIKTIVDKVVAQLEDVMGIEVSPSSLADTGNRMAFLTLPPE